MLYVTGFRIAVSDLHEPLGANHWTGLITFGNTVSVLSGDVDDDAR